MSNFTLLNEDHRLIEETAAKLFRGLAAEDKLSRQATGKPLRRAKIAEAMAEFGLEANGASDAMMQSALVQAQIAFAAGTAALAYPVLETLLAIALEPFFGADLKQISLSGAVLPAAITAENGALTGRITLVPFASEAAGVLAPARFGGRDALALIPLNVPGTAISARESIEPDYEMFDIALAGAPMPARDRLAGEESGALALLQQRSDLLAAAEIVGAARQAIDMTREHLISRTQFGQPLGIYQALKHRLADAYARTEAAAAAVNYAAAAADARDASAASYIAAAKLFAGNTGKITAETAMQLHGAIGYTMEYPLHLFMRRMHRLGNSFSRGEILDQQLFSNFQNYPEILN